MPSPTVTLLMGGQVIPKAKIQDQTAWIHEANIAVPQKIPLWLEKMRFLAMRGLTGLNTYLCWLSSWQWREPLSNRTEVPSPQDLMPDDLRWSGCNNHRNKVHNKCNVFESSPNHPPQPCSMEKLSSMKWVPGTRKAGDCRTGDNQTRRTRLNIRNVVVQRVIPAIPLPNGKCVSSWNHFILPCWVLLDADFPF